MPWDAVQLWPHHAGGIHRQDQGKMAQKLLRVRLPRLVPNLYFFFTASLRLLFSRLLGSPRYAGTTTRAASYTTIGKLNGSASPTGSPVSPATGICRAIACRGKS